MDCKDNKYLLSKKSKLVQYQHNWVKVVYWIESILRAKNQFLIEDFRNL